MRSGRRTPRRSGLVAAAIAGGLCLVSTAAVAELLRCQGPNGRTVYTDDPAVCPGATPFEPTGVITTPAAPSRQTPRAARAARRAGAAGVEEAEARRWREKKRSQEIELESIAERRSYLRHFVKICNRQGSVTTRDDAGIKQHVPCRTIRKEFGELDQREASIQTYLRQGLAEECRRAGCLPGWIR